LRKFQLEREDIRRDTVAIQSVLQKSKIEFFLALVFLLNLNFSCKKNS